MGKCLRLSLALLALLATLVAQSHEFWMLPASFVVPTGGTTKLTLATGEDFRGEKVTFSSAVVAGLRHFAPGEVIDLRGRAPASGQLGELPIVLRQAGTHLIAFEPPRGESAFAETSRP